MSTLVCFSYAGGTGSVYRDWAEGLGDGIRVVPVSLPGRGLRLREAPHTDMAPLATEVATALVEGGHTEDYAVFGHSMGALLGYEVACELRRRGHPEPGHFFASASRAPHLYGDRADHALADGELRQLVRDLGGLTGTGADDRYLDRRLPVLRADLKACERYRWRPRAPLGCPMTAFSAAGDPVAPPAEVDAWRDHTTGSLLHRQLAGDHFFLLGPSKPLLLREIRAQLEPQHPSRRTPSWTR